MKDDAWRPMREGDLDGVMALAEVVHPTFPERRAVFAEKRALFPQGCLVLPGEGAGLRGYAIAYPWHPDRLAPLDAFIERVPSPPAVLWLHDVALAPSAHGAGLARPVVARILAEAAVGGMPVARLVSVYGTSIYWGRHGFMPMDPAALGPDAPAKLAETYGDGAVLMERRLGA